MPLAEIAAFLAQPDAPLADLVCQIAALDRQLAQAAALRRRPQLDPRQNVAAYQRVSSASPPSEHPHGKL
jgi:hypothetical protein